MRFIALISCLLACVVLNMRSDPFIPGGRAKVIAYWDGVVMQKASNLAFDYSANYPRVTNQAKRNYRIVPPLLARAFGLNGMKAIKFASFCLLAACIYASLHRVSQRVAFAGTVASVATASGACYFSDWGHGCDVMAQAFLALNLVMASPILATCTTAAALFTDERAVIVLPALVLLGRQKWAPYAVGLAVYLAGRMAMGRLYVPTSYQDVAAWDTALANLRLVPMVTWSSLEGAWLIVLLSGRWLASGYAAGVGCLSSVVLDMTRSASYAILTPALALADMPERTAWRLCLAGAVVSVLVPNSYFIAGFMEEWT